MTRPVVFWAIALLAVAAAATQAYWLRWSCDDAYISFRYAAHFVEGHGLVFNRDPAEAPVEGYTNFAWTMLLALGMWLGFTGDRIEYWSQGWGVAAHAGTVLLLAAMAWRTSAGRAVVPIAAMGYAALHHAASLAPAGLETALFVLLVTAMGQGCLGLRCPLAAWRLGFLGVLLAMTRPDGGLLVAVTGCFVLYDSWRRWDFSLLRSYLLPFVLLLVPYLLWRYSYYGYWVPNTFYAKSAGDPYPGQGLRYLWEFFRCYAVLIPVLLLPVVRVWRLPASERRPWLVVLAFVLPYLGFVVWVGGDFMFSRFVLPVLPVLLLSLDWLFLPRAESPAGSRWSAPAQVGAAATLVLGLLGRSEPSWLRKHPNPLGFSDNRAISVAEFVPGISYIEAMRFAGHFLGGLFEGLDVRVGLVGSHANLAYRSRVPVAVECSTGLTDARIAHTPIVTRGAIGHEKGYAQHVRYLTHERGVQFTFDLDFRAGDLTDEWRNLVFPVIPTKLLRYDRDLLAELRRRNPDVQFVDLEAQLDRYLATLAQRSKAEVQRDFAALCNFYFDHNEDPVRRAAFEAYLR
jgi:hypothetical protein